MRSRLAALSLAGVVALGGCLDPIAPDVGGPIVGRCDPADSDPDHDVSFHVEVLPLLARAPREGGCTCHDQSRNGIGYQLSALDLTSYDALMRGGRSSGRDIVVEGDPCISILYLKLTAAPPFGARMPLGGPPYFTSDELRVVHDWIAEGADAE
ncbi:hypothetical protein [Sandaracinus amylolyticus]|uniref:hypothetical protein n=1 Tax=Sandaracinus amylolyticus TaxID=927083 RepID=UPI001F4217A5|nr:hypothetical protein [Sandaracinus amylolyticus]UJR83291.1 Hypothetical protein I5071_53590 [Sandaracinus amylolyticus]